MSPDASTGVGGSGANTPARPAQPAQPDGGRGRRRRRSSGGALIQGPAPVAPPSNPYIATRRPGCGAEIFLPSAGGAAVMAGSTPHGTPGAWTALGTPTNDLYLTRLYARRDNVYSTFGGVAVEFGYGAGPTSVDIVRGTGVMLDPSGDDIGYPWIDLPTFNTKVPAGQSLQARVNENAPAANWRVMAAGWDTAVPTFTTLNVDKPAGAGRYYPANYHLSGLTSLAGIMPAFGAWALVVDPAPNDMLVTEVLNGINGAALTVTGVAIQIGIGPAGSEVPVVTALAGRGNGMALVWPPVWVLAGERVSMRTSYVAGINQGYYVKVIDL
jgi:hypothetical protein